jgi:prepilin-type N-terminal cleavage/methylation domain-containing protein
MKRNKSQGFTLVEILIVVLIIALLALLVIPNLAEARRKSQRSRCLDNLRQINSAYQQYFLESASTTIPGIYTTTIGNYFQTGASPTCPKDSSNYTAPTAVTGGTASFPTCANAADGHVISN